MLAALLPLLLSLMRTRLDLYCTAVAYHLMVVRGAIPFIGGWFDQSVVAGLAAWSVFGIVGALPWALTWSSSDKSNNRLALGLTLASFISLLPFISALQGGHPLIGWGFLLEGWAWFGVLASFVITYALIRCCSRSERAILFVALALVLSVVSLTQNRRDMREVGPLVAANTNYGAPPKDADHIFQRYSEIRKLLALVAAEDMPRPAVIVFPETTLGYYDETFKHGFDIDILRPARRATIGLIVGREINDKKLGWLNQAVYFSPQGDVQVINQRHPAPLSMWKPWSADSFAMDLARDNLIDLGDGMKVRVLICYEEYLPFLWFIDELRGGHQAVVAIANAWPTRDTALSTVQRAHTEGLARLFGRNVLRSENRPRM